jgi:hypothetical protein
MARTAKRIPSAIRTTPAIGRIHVISDVVVETAAEPRREATLDRATRAPASPMPTTMRTIPRSRCFIGSAA